MRRKGTASNGRDAVEAQAVEVLRSAVRRVIVRLFETRGTSDASDPDDHLIHDAEAFRAAVEGVLVGEVPRVTVAALPPTAVPLVALVRGEVLADSESEYAASSVLEVLRALERLNDAWHSTEGAACDSDLRAWLSRPDALDLVVELAHDLRSPLTSIMFLSETIQNADRGSLSDVQRRQLSLIYISALGLSSVVADVVELAVDEHDLVDARDASEFWVAEVLENVITLVRPMAEEKDLALRLMADQDERWYGHPTAIYRVMLNLVTNALKFTETGAVEVGMRRVNATDAEFFVEDTGRGIPEQQLSALLEPFRRRERDGSHRFSGSGLGLSICQRYLHQMGSELEVETVVGEGTRFFFRLEGRPSR